MATSGSYDNISTLDLIIKDAFSLIGAIDDDEPIPAEMFVYGKRKLNHAMRWLSTRPHLWLIDDITVTLTPGTASYTAGVSQTINTPKPMKLIDARRVQSGGNEIPIDIVSRDEYLSIPNKTLQAAATMVYYKPEITNGTLYVWPTGTTTENTLKITARRPIQDFDDEGNNPDLPEEWILAIEHVLAVLIAPKYLGGVVPVDLRENTTDLLSGLTIYDEENVSIFLQIDDM